MWTFDELEARLHAREHALRARDRWLGLPFLALLGLAGLLVLAAALELPAPVEILRAGAAGVLTALAALAAYMLATARRFRRRHDVLCPHCGGSVACLREWIELPVESAGTTPLLRCPDCEEVIARRDVAA
jgi:hypothetical protein